MIVILHGVGKANIGERYFKNINSKYGWGIMCLSMLEVKFNKVG